MVAKKTAVSRTASARSTVAAAAETTEETPAGTGPEAGGKAPAGKAAKKAAKKAVKKAAKAVRKAAVKKTAAGKPPAKKAAATEAAEAAEQTGAHTVVAKKSASRTTAAAGKSATAVPQARVAAATAPGELAVRPGEDPWTPEEVTEARTELSSEVMRLRSELEASGAALAGLMRDSGDGAGDDDADTGTKNITREHELSLAANAQEMLEQTERALARLDAGTYGLCEVCGKPIGKARMQAFPRATLCVEDKQKQERRG
ncbi:TraR/DksA family transcriptional regulator [Streptomyces sp. 24-1644]|uniref:TraR/DksA family transcriptional regulator n=1 Tax=Streptomyces sp. 24-1644 TaxID=3457315 RepID=UPI003FA77F87